MHKYTHNSPRTIHLWQPNIGGATHRDTTVFTLHWINANLHARMRFRDATPSTMLRRKYLRGVCVYICVCVCVFVSGWCAGLPMSRIRDIYLHLYVCRTKKGKCQFQNCDLHYEYRFFGTKHFNSYIYNGLVLTTTTPIPTTTTTTTTTTGSTFATGSAWRLK